MLQYATQYSNTIDVPTCINKGVEEYILYSVQCTLYSEGEFLVGFEGLESTLRIGLAVGRPWSQNHKFLVVASAFHRVGSPAVANPIPSR